MAADIQVKKRFTRRRLIVTLIVYVAVIAAGWLFYLGLSLTGVGGLLGLKPPLWFKESRYIEVMNDIATGQLVAKPKTGPFALMYYADYVVQLPPSHQNLTPAGIVFAEERIDGRWFVIFPTWHGFHHDIKGYLYCSEPLTPDDFHLDSGSGYEAVIVCGQVLQVTHIKGSWYSVDRGFD
jgi:hypothetical protein